MYTPFFYPCSGWPYYFITVKVTEVCRPCLRLSCVRKDIFLFAETLNSMCTTLYSDYQIMEYELYSGVWRRVVVLVGEELEAWTKRSGMVSSFLPTSQ